MAFHYHGNVTYGLRSFPGHVAGTDFSSRQCASQAGDRSGIGSRMGGRRRPDLRAARGTVYVGGHPSGLFPGGLAETKTLEEMKEGVRREVRERYARH